MLGPVFELMLDAVDMAMTIVVLLALWEGRSSGYRSRMIGWLAGRNAARQPVDQFLAAARRAQPRALSSEIVPPAPGSPLRQDGDQPGAASPDLHPDTPSPTGPA